MAAQGAGGASVGLYQDSNLTEVAYVIDHCDATFVVVAGRDGKAHRTPVSLGRLAGDTLEYTGADWGSRFSLKWKDINAGIMDQTIINNAIANSGVARGYRFSRLDG